MKLTDSINYLLSPIRNPEFWVFMGKSDIHYKYKRTVMGPWWLTLTNGAYIAMLALVFGALFKAEDPLYVPWVASGVILWNTISGILRESSTVYFDKKGFLLQSGEFAAPQLIYWVFWRNALVFLHQVPIVIVVLLLFKSFPDIAHLLWLIPGIVMLYFSLMPVCLVMSLLTARLRDLEPLIVTGLMALFFVTPIMWQVDMLGDRQWLASLNPMTYLIELLRNPMLGLPVDPMSYAVTGALGSLFWLLAAGLYAKFSNRLAFWI